MTVSLVLAIGANTTIFSIAKQLLLARLDIPDATNLRLLTASDANFSYLVYQALRAQNRVLGDLLAFHVTAIPRQILTMVRCDGTGGETATAFASPSVRVSVSQRTDRRIRTNYGSGQNRRVHQQI